MSSDFYMKINDYTPEPSGVSLTGLDLNAANFDAQITLAQDLVTAINNISIGLAIRWHVQHNTQINADESAAATNAFAQREAKWLVRYHGNVGGKKYRCEIPCPDLDLLDANNKGYMDLDDAGVGAAFKSAFEAYVKDEFGNGVTVDSVQHVGRNV